MAAWSLDWNDLSGEHRADIIKAAQKWACQCSGGSGQIAVEMFGAVVGVIKARDVAEVRATLGLQADGATQ